MKARRIAIKGMLILVCIVLVCLFFSGTIKNIVTPKVQFAAVKTGKLTHRYQFTGKVMYPETEAFYYAAPQPVVISQVNVRPGDVIKAGDVLFSMRYPDPEAMALQLEGAYRNALIDWMEFEQAYAGYQPDPRTAAYMDAYAALRMATINEGEEKLRVERMLPSGVVVPEEGYPAGSSAATRQAIDAWRKASADKQTAKDTFANLADGYSPTESDQQYMMRDQETSDNIHAAGSALNAFYTERDAMSAVRAPYDGYVAAVNVRTGSTYDGSMPLCMLTDTEGTPVIEIAADDMERAIPDGTAVVVMTQWGDFGSEVLAAGVNSEGSEYVHIAIPEGLSEMGVTLNRLHSESITISVALQSDTAHSLVPVSAIHGSGDNRYVYIVEENKTALGGTEMNVTKLLITVIDEADGFAAVEEKLTRVQLAYMEDRPLSDGSAVMGAVQ